MKSNVNKDVSDAGKSSHIQVAVKELLFSVF